MGPLHVLEILLLLMTFYVQIKSSYSPIYVWGVHYTAEPTLRVTDSHYFGKKMTPHLRNHCIIAFMEQNLTQSDFLCTQPATKQSCFQHMKQYSPATYINLVKDPYRALRKISRQNLNIWINSTGHRTYPIDCAPGIINFVFFNDTILMKRNQRLTHHDKMIANINCDMQSMNNSAVFMYLSKHNSELAILMDTAHERKRRFTNETANVNVTQTESESNITDDRYYHSSNEFVLLYTKLLLKYNNNTVEKLEVSNITCTTADIVLSVELKLPNDSKIVLNITNYENYYIVSSIEYNQCQVRPFLFEIPSHFSYLCNSLEIKCTDFAVVFESLQFEVLYRIRNSKKSKKPKPRDEFQFKPPWNCVGFVTPAITSGIFVIIFMGSIVMCGINWIADINSCDQYDDPTKPTIVVQHTAL